MTVDQKESVNVVNDMINPITTAMYVQSILLLHDINFISLSHLSLI